MKVTINGTIKELTGSSHVSDIVAQFCQQSKHVITEINGRIVPCSDWNSTPVSEGDRIELVAFVGGG